LGGLRVYPKPMFDFEERRKFCIEKIKKAYKVGMRGDDPRVLDGRWRGVFGSEDEVQEPGEGSLGKERGTDEVRSAVAEKEKEISGDAKLVLGKKKAVKRKGGEELLSAGNAEAAAKPATRRRGAEKTQQQQQQQQTTLDMMVGPSKKKAKQ
jgi:cryptochrome